MLGEEGLIRWQICELTAFGEAKRQINDHSMQPSIRGIKHFLMSLRREVQLTSITGVRRTCARIAFAQSQVARKLSGMGARATGQLLQFRPTKNLAPTSVTGRLNPALWTTSRDFNAEVARAIWQEAERGQVQ